MSPLYKMLSEFPSLLPNEATVKEALADLPKRSIKGLCDFLLSFKRPKTPSQEVYDAQGALEERRGSCVALTEAALCLASDLDVTLQPQLIFYDHVTLFCEETGEHLDFMNPKGHFDLDAYVRVALDYQKKPTKKEIDPFTKTLTLKTFLAMRLTAQAHHLYNFTSSSHQEVTQPLYRALSIDANYPVAHNLFGDIALKQDNPVLAEQYFLRAMQIDPHYHEARLGIAHAKYKLGEETQAINICQELLTEPVMVKEAREKVRESLYSFKQHNTPSFQSATVKRV